MEKVSQHLAFIFYLPLVMLTFIFVAFGLFSLFATNQAKLIPEPIITDGSFKTGEPWAFFANNRVEAPRQPLAFADIAPTRVLSAVLGEGNEKWVDVNLSTQTLTAYEPDGRVFMQVPVSTGLWAPTPTGSYRIWAKLRYTTMKGGSKELGTYYYLPNVPCTQYFYKGYGLHGAYWHDNFGHPMSHGCVNMRIADSCQLFEWTTPILAANQSTGNASSADPGTKVVVHN